MKILSTFQKMPQEIKSNIKTIRQIPYQHKMNRAVSDIFKRDKFMNTMRKASHKNRFSNIQAGYSPELPKTTFLQKIFNSIKK